MLLAALGVGAVYSAIAATGDKQSKQNKPSAVQTQKQDQGVEVTGSYLERVSD
jgi:hypothetical protein